MTDAPQFIFLGGRIETLDPRVPHAEAVAVTGTRISAVGAASDIAALRGPRTEMVELVGRTLLPGFYDAHQHQADAGLLRHQVDARTKTIEALIDRVRRAAANRPATTWISGWGYDENHFAERRPPTRGDLDLAAPNHPAVVTRTCGHALVANSRALAEASIDRNTPDPAGGRIERDAGTGEPNGVLHERAMALVESQLPRASRADVKEAILAEAAGNLSLGITSVWEPAVDLELAQTYREMAEQGQLPIRVTMAQLGVLRSGETLPLPQRERIGRLGLVAVKLLVDGAIAPRTAAMTEPYEGEGTNRGMLLWSQEELDREVAAIHARGLQASIHAIGDAAIASALTAVEAALAATPKPDHRHRIEHCGLPTGSLPSRVARAGVIAVLQPIFVHAHGEAYVRNLGPRRSLRLYPTRSLLGAGVVVAGSSDSPVVPDRNPLLGMRAAMTRTAINGDEVAPEEAISLAESLRLYTISAAFAAGEDDRKGSLTRGKLADLVVLSEDIRAVPPEELDRVEVERVFLDGRPAGE